MTSAGARSSSAYRVVVYRPDLTGSARARNQLPTVWDSGQVMSGEQVFVAYGGPALAPDTVYRWTVQSWPATGGPSPLAPHATFETGLGDHDWKAKWISRAFAHGPGRDVYTYARSEFTLASSPIVRARAYVSGDQQYELYLNGTRAGKGQAYSFPDSQYYETLDVTTLLRAGHTNAVGIVSSWQGPTKGHPAGKPGVIMQISVLYRNGRRALVVSDGSWRVRAGPWLAGTQRDLEGDLVDFTENIDGRAEPVGWQEPGFDDSSWARATVLGPAGVSPWRHLVSVRTRIVEEPVAAVTLTRLSSGAVVADFGKVYAAVPTVSFHHGTPGRLVTMRAGYLLDEPVAGQPFTGVPGQVSTTHGTQHTDMSYSYVQRGGERGVPPLRLPRLPLLPDRRPRRDAEPRRRRGPHPPRCGPRRARGDVRVVVGRSSTPSSNSSRHSALFGAQEQWIDTPTREKGPWLWDGFNESQTAMVAFGEQNLTRRSLLEFAQSQSRFWAKSGAVNKIYPTGLGAEDINEYTEIYPEWVWQYWMRTGDRALLRAVYPVLVNIAGYIQASLDSAAGLVDDLLSTDTYYDYPVVTRDQRAGRQRVPPRRRRRRGAREAGERGERPQTEPGPARGRHQPPPHPPRRDLRRRHRRRRGQDLDRVAVRQRLRRSPTASSPPRAACRAWPSYVAGFGMGVPVNTATEVLKGLADNGRLDDVIAILTDPVHDGWANILAQGATYTWEVWQPSDADGDSMSHGWGSNVLVEIDRTLLGVAPLTPGYASFSVTPPRTALDWAGGTVPTPRGPIDVAWSRPTSSGDPFVLDLTVPPNAAATVTLAAAGSNAVTEGGRALRGAPGVRTVTAGHGQVVAEVGAGRYEFRVTPSGHG